MKHTRYVYSEDGIRHPEDCGPGARDSTCADCGCCEHCIHSGCDCTACGCAMFGEDSPTPPTITVIEDETPDEVTP